MTAANKKADFWNARSLWVIVVVSAVLGLCAYFVDRSINLQAVVTFQSVSIFIPVGFMKLKSAAEKQLDKIYKRDILSYNEKNRLSFTKSAKQKVYKWVTLIAGLNSLLGAASLFLVSSEQIRFSISFYVLTYTVTCTIMYIFENDYYTRFSSLLDDREEARNYNKRIMESLAGTSNTDS